MPKDGPTDPQRRPVACVSWISPNKKGDSENLLDALLLDGEFYERENNRRMVVSMVEREAERFK